MIFIGYITSIFLVILGLRKKKSKFIFTIQCIWLWILQGLNCGGMDYNLNEAIYHGGGIPGEWLSRIIINIFLKANINYMLYCAVISTFCILIFAYVVKTHSKMPCIVCNLYYIFLLVDNVIQKRFFFASILILLGFHFLMKGKKLLYFFMVILAVGFHTSTFVFLFFPFLQKWVSKNFWIKIILLLTIEIVLIPVIPSMLQKVGLNYISLKYIHYIYEERYRSVLVAFLFFGVYTFFTISIEYIGSFLKKRNAIDNFIMDINKAAVIILPFLLYNSNFTRYYRTILILDYIFISNCISNRIKRGSLSNVFLIGFIVVSGLSSLAIRIASGGFGAEVLFANNYLLQILFG